MSESDGAFVDRVRDRLDADERQAREAADAVLETLADRITGGEAEDLAVAVPGEAGESLAAADHDAEQFGPEEFERRVGGRLDADVDAHAATVATVAAIEDTVRGDEVDDLRDQLPSEYGDLLDEADAGDSD